MSETIGPPKDALTFRTGDTPEGEGITDEMPPADNDAQCLIRRGACLTTCELYPRALALTREFGVEYIRRGTRRQVLLADRFDPPGEEISQIAMHIAEVLSVAYVEPTTKLTNLLNIEADS